MVQIAVAPTVLKDVLLQLGDNNFETACSSVIFTPNATSVTWQGLTPASSFTDVASALWTVALTFVQDWDTPQSLSEFLYDNEGITVPAYFRPRNGKGSAFSTNVVITPGAVGGAVNTYNESTVTLGAKGKPTRIAAAVTIPTATLATPSTSPIAGNKLVKITGTGFSSATAVAFGSVAAVDFRIDSDSVIYATAPAQAVGSKPIKVTNSVGAATVLAPFSYV
jgi:hypothetical protein